MFEFKKVCELMFLESKVSSKTNNQYIILRVLSDDGSTMDVVYKGSEPINFGIIKLRDFYEFTFQFINKGQYSSLVCTHIKKVDTK